MLAVLHLRIGNWLFADLYSDLQRYEAFANNGHWRRHSTSRCLLSSPSQRQKLRLGQCFIQTG